MYGSFSTSLHHISTVSQVLFGYPTACKLSTFLPFLGCTAYLISHSLCGAHRLSLVDMISLYDMTWFSDTAGVYVFSPYRIPSCCFPPSSQRQPPIQQSFRCSIARPAALLSTLRTYCCQHEPKTRL